MNHLKVFFLLLMAGGILLTAGCDEDDPSDLGVLSIQAVGTDLNTGNSIVVDLNGVSAALDVPTDAIITILFDKNLDPATVAGAISLTGGSGGSATLTTAGNAISITPDQELDRGTAYTLSIGSTLTADDGAAFTAVSRTFFTAGRAAVIPPQADKQTGFWEFNGSTESSVGTFTTTKEQVGYDTDRHGQLNSALYFNGATGGPGTGDIVDIQGTGLLSPSMTITVWFRLDTLDYDGSRFMFGYAVERGYFMELGSGGINWMKFATCHKLDPDPNAHIYGTAWTDMNGDGATSEITTFDWEGSYSDWLADNTAWHQLAMTYDANESIKSIYLDGTLIMEQDLKGNTSSMEWWMSDMEVNELNTVGLVHKLGLGYACASENGTTSWATYADAENTYKGYLDDLRIFSVSLSETQIQQLYNDEKP